jgi:hypothetical protein
MNRDEETPPPGCELPAEDLPLPCQGEARIEPSETPAPLPPGTEIPPRVKLPGPAAGEPVEDATPSPPITYDER